MTDITSPTARSLREVLRQSSMPFFLFAVTFLGLVVLSSAVLLPRFQRVPLAGQLLTLSEARHHEEELLATMQLLEERRTSATFPTRDGLYQALQAQVADAPSWIRLRTEITQTTTRIVDAGAIHLSSMTYDAAGFVDLEGDVRGAGARSLTMLARFDDALGFLPGVTAVRRPIFTRIDDPTLGPISPFSIRLTIDPSPLADAS